VFDDAIAAVDAAALDELTQTRQPGLTLGVTDRERTLTVRTYGFADVAARKPVEENTLFEIGSIGKSFTALAVLQLVDEGRIDLGAPVARYLPWFEVAQPPEHRPITIEDLLSHTAGISAGIDGTPEATFQVWALRELPIAAAPGERFHYSNVGYKALGLMLEAVEGRRYPEILRTRILDPLGMTATEPEITHDIRARLAVGYEYLHDDRVGHPEAPLAPATWLETDTADGSIASTAADMCAFVRFLLRAGDGPTGRVLSPRMFAAMVADRVRVDETYAYGLGLAIRDLDGRRFIGHGGGMVGYLAGMQADVNAGIGVVVLQNGVSSNPMTLARTVIANVGDGSKRPPPVRIRSDGREIAGIYESAGDRIEIVSAQDGPVLRAGGREIALDVLGDDLYLAPDPEFDRFRFRAERAGADEPELWHGGRRYVRKGNAPSPLPPPSPELAAIEGHYRSHNPWTTNFRIVLRGDRPWLTFAAAPDGFDDEQPLTLAADGSFLVGDDPLNPERVRFDTPIDGRARRAWLSGWPYYRV
jgi:D-alanyl-D-alanine carboxypeptidase